MIKKGILKAWHVGTYTADVQIIGSFGVWLMGIPVTRGIEAAAMVVGRTVAVCFLDPGNPEDAVVTAVWA
jgi:hypothetical protein